MRNQDDFSAKQGVEDIVYEWLLDVFQHLLAVNQIHARLRAAGYPENLFDAYLPSGSGAPTTQGTQPGAGNDLDVLSAAKQLGIVDSTDFAANAANDVNPQVVPNCDSLVADTTSARRRNACRSSLGAR